MISHRILLALALLSLSSARRAYGAQTRDAEEQYRFLAGLVDKGLHELAVDEARAFLRAHPEHQRASLARYRLGNALWELGRQDEAAVEYETLAREAAFEYRAECLFRLGEQALARGDAKRARAAFQAVLRSDQAYLHAPARFSLGESAFAARDFAAAERWYLELLGQQPDAEQAPLAARALAWCAWERDDHEETVSRARQALERGLETGPADELRLLSGEALLALQRPQEALEAFRSVQSRERQAERSRGEGFALSALGDLAGAGQAFERLLEVSPGSPHAAEARLQAGIARLQAGDPRGALARLGEASAGGDPQALFWLAQAQKESGDAEGALASLERALRARPAVELEARIQVLRGDLLAGTGRSGEALAAYEKGGSDYALYAGAVAALNQGDPAGALRLAERLLRERAESSHAEAARTVLAEALFAAERYPEAERAFGAVLERAQAPAQEARARSRLAWCRYLSGDLDGAARAFEELLARHPRSSEAEEGLALLARIHADRGESAAALEAGERYLELHPDGPHGDQALHALARAASGEERLRRMEELLERFPESPLRGEALLEAAELSSAAGDFARAEQRYRELLERSRGGGDAARALYGLAWCRFQVQDSEGCARELENLLRLEDAPGELRVAGLELRVWAEARRGAPEKAAQAWRRFAAETADEKRRFEAARVVLRSYRDAGRSRESQAFLEESLRTLESPELVAGALVETAYLALEEQDLESAEAALASARSRVPHDARTAEAAFHLGEARFERGDSQQALLLYEDAIRAENPRAPDALYKLGFLRLQRGELEPAEQALRALLERAPENGLGAEARFLLGEVLYRRELYAEAAAELARARPAAADVLLARILFRLGLALGRLERWSECEEALSELASRFGDFPNLAEAELWRGRALAAQKKTRGARAAFERTIALDPGELAAAARLALGALLETEGRTEEALSEYLKVALLYAHEESVAEALLRAGQALETLGQGEQARERYRELVSDHPRSAFAASARARLRELEPAADAR